MPSLLEKEQNHLFFQSAVAFQVFRYLSYIPLGFLFGVVVLDISGVNSFTAILFQYLPHAFWTTLTFFLSFSPPSYLALLA